jgi:hypothetical protein
MENIREKIENEVIDLINFSSGGRLIITKLEKDKYGMDMSIQRRGNY